MSIGISLGSSVVEYLREDGKTAGGSARHEPGGESGAIRVSQDLMTHANNLNCFYLT